MLVCGEDGQSVRITTSTIRHFDIFSRCHLGNTRVSDFSWVSQDFFSLSRGGTEVSVHFSRLLHVMLTVSVWERHCLHTAVTVPACIIVSRHVL